MNAKLYITAFIGSAFVGALISALLNMFVVPFPADAAANAFNNAASGFGSGGVAALMTTFMTIRALKKRDAEQHRIAKGSPKEASNRDGEDDAPEIAKES